MSNDTLVIAQAEELERARAEERDTARVWAARHAALAEDLAEERATVARLMALLAEYESGEREDLARVTAECEAWRLASLGTREALMEREVTALQEIIAGRTAPPSDEEIAAHAAAGGRWLSSTDVRSLVYEDVDGLTADAECARREEGPCILWHALDADGRPCSWPVVPNA